MASYTIRPYIPDDLDYVIGSWLDSWRVSKFAGTIPNHLYAETQRTLIEDLIARGAVIVVADTGRVLKNGKPLILGFACGEVKDNKTVAHYVVTKDPYRGRGIEDALLEALPGSKPGYFTHYSSSSRFARWEWVPEMCRRKVL